MFSKKIKTAIVFTIIISTVFVGKANAQQNNGMYFMKLVPQANYLNPAIQNQCGLYFGAPALASMQFDLNTGIGINDVFYYDSEIDSLVTFLASSEYQDDFIKRLNRSKNLISFENHMSIGSFGFRVNNLYLNFDIQAKTNVSGNIPADLLAFVLKGNYDYENDQTIDYDLSGFDINASSYLEYSVGASYKINEQLTVGLRPKFLMGVIDLSTADQDIQINSTEEQIDFKADITLNGALPFVEPVENEEGLVDSFVISDNAVNDITGGLSSNTGLALDIGAIYNVNDEISVYGSLIDLGWISWKSGASNFSLVSAYKFGGLDIAVEDLLNEEEGQESNADTSGMFSAITDSIRESFDIKVTSSPYKTNLSPKLYLGGTYKVHEKIDLGVLSRTQIQNKRLRQQLTLSANFLPAKFFNATVSYTIRNYTFNNLGYGLAYKFGPLNTYVVIDKSLMTSMMTRDKIILPSDGGTPREFPIPHNFNKYSLRFGVNLMFGCKNQEQSISSPKKSKKSSLKSKMKNADKPIID